jgi:hypothetical protein
MPSNQQIQSMIANLKKQEGLLMEGIQAFAYRHTSRLRLADRLNEVQAARLALEWASGVYAFPQELMAARTKRLIRKEYDDA